MTIWPHFKIPQKFSGSRNTFQEYSPIHTGELVQYLRVAHSDSQSSHAPLGTQSYTIQVRKYVRTYHTHTHTVYTVHIILQLVSCQDLQLVKKWHRVDMFPSLPACQTREQSQMAETRPRGSQQECHYSEQWCTRISPTYVHIRMYVYVCTYIHAHTSQAYICT